MKLLREMQPEDIDAVVAVIDTHDDDDAEEAEDGYRKAGGTYDQFVLEKEGEIIGVTGYATPPACDGTYWLSWTYVHEDHTGQGHGRAILTELIEHLQAQGGRKLFVKVSDYVDEEDGAIYAAAMHLYQDLGFSVELKIADYYDEGEAQYMLGLRLKPATENKVEDESWPIQFNAVFEIAETDGAWSFGWHDQGDALFSQEDVELGINSVREEDGRMVCLSFPANYPEVHQRLLSCGFQWLGQLEDYFEDGVDENHYLFIL